MLAHHASGRDPSDITQLSELAVKHGIFPSTSEAETFLTGGKQMDAEVRKGYYDAQRMGISGVPFFVFDDKYAVSGAVGEEAFLEVSPILSVTTGCHICMAMLS